MFEDKSMNAAFTSSPAGWRVPASQTYLSSARAVSACTREFERIINDVAELGDDDAGTSGLKIDVKRAPGRCIVQAGPIALTVSWIRGNADAVAEGRLLVIEWEGTVGGRAPRSTTSTPPVPRAGATLLREDVYLADATADTEWLWRFNDTGIGSAELARRYVESFRGRVAAYAAELA